MKALALEKEGIASQDSKEDEATSTLNPMKVAQPMTVTRHKEEGSGVGAMAYGSGASAGAGAGAAAGGDGAAGDGEGSLPGEVSSKAAADDFTEIARLNAALQGGGAGAPGAQGPDMHMFTNPLRAMRDKSGGRAKPPPPAATDPGGPASGARAGAGATPGAKRPGPPPPPPGQ